MSRTKEQRQALAEAGVHRAASHYVELAPLDRLRLITHAGELARRAAMTEAQIAHMRLNCVTLNSIIDREERGEITEQQAKEEFDKVMSTQPDLQDRLVSHDGRSINHGQNVEIAQASLKAIDQNIKQQNEFVARVADAKLALELAVNSFRKDSLTFLDEMGTYLTNIRQTRMALDQETRHLLTAAGDVRKFFLSEDHPKELERLKEFVAIMERLQTLKNSGFLDAVTDTILKLAPTTV